MAGKDYLMKVIFRGVDMMTGTVKGITGAMTLMNKQTKTLRGHLSGAQGMMGGVTGGIEGAAFRLLGAGAVIGTAVAAIVKSGADFEDTMIRAGVKFGAGIVNGTKEFEALKNKALMEGERTEFTAVDFANMFKTMGQAGVSFDRAIGNMADITRDVATFDGSSLEDSFGLIRDSQLSMSMESINATEDLKNYERVANMVAFTASNATTNIRELAEGFSYGAQGFVDMTAGAGQTIPELMATAKALAGVGIRSSRMGTGLKALTRSLVDSSSEGAEVLRQLGVQTTHTVDGMSRMRGVGDIMKDVIDAFKTNRFTANDLAKRADMISTIFGEIGASSARALIRAVESGSYEESFNKFNKLWESEENYLAGVAEDIRNSVMNQFMKLISAIYDKMIKAFLDTSSEISKSIQNLTATINREGDSIIETLSGFITTVMSVVEWIVEWHDILVPLGLALSTFYMAITVLIPVVWALNAAMAANPVGLIVIAIAGLITFVVLLITYLDDIAQWFRDMPFLLKVFLATNPFTAWLVALMEIAELLGFIETKENGKNKAVSQAGRNGFDWITRPAMDASGMSGVLDVNFNNAPPNTEISAAKGKRAMKIRRRDRTGDL